MYINFDRSLGLQLSADEPRGRRKSVDAVTALDLTRTTRNPRQGLSFFKMLGFSLAVTAGFCAACASAFAKLAMSGEQIELVCQSLKENACMEIMPDCSVVTLVLRVISFCFLFLFNALMWTLFVKSLQLARSSLEATITNSSANLFFTAIIGFLVFGESVSPTWMLGSTFIILGVWMIHRGGKKADKIKTS